MNRITKNAITYEDACEGYFNWAKNQAECTKQPSESLSEIHYGIWHLEDINGPLAAVTTEKEIVPVSEFFAAYERLAKEGKCDCAGGMEYRRVLAEWIEKKPTDMDSFIVSRANAGPLDATTESAVLEETPKAPSKKLKIILFGEEVTKTHTEAIVELPTDASKEEILELGGSELESMLWDTSECVEWIPGDIQSQITFEEVVVEPCLEDEEPDLCLVRDEAGELVLEKPK
ncbi:MAG: hypothetical protein CME33_19640 [Gimesia sp.]|uniref:hypothetical protein n=1 Tax=Gimesia sp. TaxID=2024833 RepID=UPI000C53F010|nr:hypothetical protein [Gimesia sp.]MAX38776.1 hypothetical protein [Gimesia sp.]|tara:strand:- start:2780 stop:3472 length:693 start_codon:yes stop_codon:yes gene_type:complete